MKRIYLGGPMRGYDLWNFPAFDEGCRVLREFGYDVISPHEHDEQLGFSRHAETLEGFDLRATFLWDVEQVCAADGVVVLDGWETSKGATAEVAVARAIGIPVLTVAEAVRMAEGVTA